MEERYAEETQTLRELLALMHEHDLDTLKVKLGDAVYELSRRQPEPAAGVAGAVPAAPVHAGAEPAADANVTKVVAPLTGVFYRSPRPMHRPTSNAETASSRATSSACSKR